ncbi:MAG: hypothetical protein H0V66_04805, partial [Bdellovibrionales bacterium]|nr:hypothetical protein [Bdellovibrionales bacterium]
MTVFVGHLLVMPKSALTDKEGMKAAYLMLLFISFPVWSTATASTSGVKGSVASPKTCIGPVMVWVSLDKDDYKERLLLMHTEVPVGGTFQFYLKPGDYQIRASDEKGCDFLKQVTVTKSVSQIDVK